MEEKKTRGRPKIYDANKINEDLKKYLSNSNDPYIEEFILSQEFSADTFYRLAKENQDLSDTTKRVHEVQKLRTVRKAEVGEINPTFAIFKLKQKCYGWTDKQEIDMNANVSISFEQQLQELIEDEE